MKTFWNDLLCGVLGHPGTWVADYSGAAISTPEPRPVGNGIYQSRIDKNDRQVSVYIPWRCPRCRRTLAEIRDDYSIEPDWLKKLGW